MTKSARLVLMFVLLGLVPSVDAVAAEKVTLGYLRGASGAPIEVMRGQKLGERHGVDIDYKLFLDVAAMDRALVLGEHDVSLNISLNTWANYLNRGNDIVGVFGTLYPPGFIVVPAKSPYRELKDLVGKRVGVYSINGTSTAILGVIANEQLGIDIRKSMQLFGSPAPTLAALLAKGEVDAISSLPPFVPKMVRSGDYRVLIAEAAEWQKMTGQPLPFGVMAVTRKTLQTKPAAVKGVVAAYRAAAEQLRRTPDAMNAYLVEAGITAADDQKFAQEMMIPQYMETWTQRDVDIIRVYWDKAVKAKFIEAPVRAQNWYTFDFAR